MHGRRSQRLKKEKLLLTEEDRDHVRNELENQKENQIEKDYALTKMRENVIHPTYDAAIHRRKIIAENLELILCTMELDPLNLSPKLQAIHNKKFIRSKRRRARPNELSPGMISSKDERVSKLKNIENIMNALQPMESSDIDENETISMFGSIEENNEGLQYNDDIDSLSDEYLLLCERDLKRRLALGFSNI